MGKVSNRSDFGKEGNEENEGPSDLELLVAECVSISGSEPDEMLTHSATRIGVAVFAALAGLRSLG